MTWEDYPYVAQRQNSCLLHGNKTTSLAVAYQLNPDELSIIDWLVNYGPVNIGMDISGLKRAGPGFPETWAQA
jgi:hypothetical protein